MPYDTAKMRAKLKAQMTGRPSDPNEFRTPKVTEGKLAYRFYVCPPLQEGDKCATGVASRSMDVYHVPYGAHWVDKRPHVCPRLVSEGEVNCEMCTKGFDLIKEAKAHQAPKETITAIAKQWLSQATNIINIYFPPHPTNPEEVHGRVMFYKMPKAVADALAECLEQDDAGDPESPRAFGAFFDEEAGFMFELVVTPKGGNNTYDKSRFPEGQRAKPFVAKADGTPDRKAIQKILDSRHDLYTKIEVVDKKALKRLVDKLWDGDDDDDDNGAGFDKDEVVEARQTAGRATRRPQPEPEDEEDDKPVGKTNGKANGKANGKPARQPQPEDEDETPKPTKAARRPQLEDEDDTPKPTKAARRPQLEDEDETPKPTKKDKALAQEEEVVAPPKSKKPQVDDVDDLLSQINDD